MIVKAFCVLIAASVLPGCENKPKVEVEQNFTASIQPSEALISAAEHLASAKEWVPSAIEAAPTGSAQEITLEALQNAAKDTEEDQVHE